MRDLKVTSAKTALRVTSVSPIRGFLPPAVLILGEKFDLASEVVYNNISVSEFAISGPTRIVARIPESQIPRPLTELNVFAPAKMTRQNALIELGLQASLRQAQVEGLERLVQEWVLVFLSTPGSDIFDPESGGGALALIGKSVTDKETVTADLVMAVERTKSQIMKAQAANASIPPSERLLSATLADVVFNKSTTTLSAVVHLRNVLGNPAVVTVG